ncbi:MAG TPA: N-acetylmuramoyl-L-alanine amidase [Spirochaetia bacterium]|nr:N-acetylmuramoyl-L-alanine amidase [Spirochaetia bacterium]
MKRLSILILLLSLPAALFSDYVDIADVLKETGSSLEYDTLLESGMLASGRTRVSFTVNAPWIIVNDGVKLSTPGIRREKGRLLIPEETAAKIIGVFRGDESPGRVFRVGAIVIDPGHGGRDSGASYTHTVNGKKVRISEKDVVLKAGFMLYELLKKRFPDKVVLMTRTRDVTLSLEERPEIANSISLGEDEAIIYISLHANASLSGTARGFEVWYLTATYKRNLLSTASVDSEYHDILPIMNSMQDEEFTRESILLARSIMQQLETAVGKETENRGLKEGEWLVVRKAKMPSILIELGFLSNRDEALKLASDEYLQKLSFAIYNGVSSFIEKFEQSNAFTE